MTSEKARWGRARTVSFDVFDTCLVRATAPPNALYLLLGNSLSAAGEIPCTPEVFARARYQAESDVWRREGGLDAPVRLTDFYEEVVDRLFLEPTSIGRLAKAELALERKLLRVNPVAQRLISAHVSRGSRIVFISDTYFEAVFLEHLLRDNGLWPEGASLVASSDFEASKASGALFRILLNNLGIPPEDLIHYGDNPLSDQHSPELIGIRAIGLSEGRINRYEQLLANHQWQTGGLTALFAGASRLARLHTTAEDSNERAIRDVAAGVAAPFLVSFVLWIFANAKRAGITKLVFVARDGQVMFEVAQLLAKTIDPGIEFSYLFASRESVNLAGIFRGEPDELNWVLRDLDRLTPIDVLKRCDIEWPEVASIMREIGVDPTAPPGSDDSMATLQALTEIEELKNTLMRKAAARRRLVTDYLNQRKLLDGSRIGLIDFGGVGSQMRALFEILSWAGVESTRIFLVGLDRLADAGLPAPAAPQRWLDHTECYLYDHRRGSGIRRSRGFGTSVQMFCAADHGTVLGYEYDSSSDGQVNPVLAVQRDFSLLSWGLDIQRAAILAFAEHLELDEALVDNEVDTREAVTAAIDLFWTAPTREEALAWGRFPFEGAETRATTRLRLARSYSLRQIALGVLQGSFPNLSWTHWYEGSRILSPWHVRSSLKLAEDAYRRLARTRHPLAQAALGRAHQWRRRLRRG